MAGRGPSWNSHAHKKVPSSHLEPLHQKPVLGLKDRVIWLKGLVNQGETRICTDLHPATVTQVHHTLEQPVVMTTAPDLGREALCLLRRPQGMQLSEATIGNVEHEAWDGSRSLGNRKDDRLRRKILLYIKTRII